MMTRSQISQIRISGASLLPIALAALSQPAMAQETENLQTASSSSQLGVIVVTANRREENLQDIAISGATIESEQVQTIFDGGADITALAARVPGLFVESSNGRAAPRFYIRGLGNTDFDLAASQPVSLVMDDVVMENVTLKAFPLFDVDRIEVLRGPQGSLFGRNTPAGIVKIDTRKPTEELSAQASLSVGSYASVAFEAGIGGAIIPGKIAARISVMSQGRDDFIDNGFTAEQNVYGGYKQQAIRGQLLITPSDRLSILGSVQYSDLEGHSTLFRANILGPGDNELNQNYDRDTVFYDAGGNNRSEYRVLGTTLRLEYEFDGATLTSITSYNESDGSSRGDIDGGNMVTGPGFIPFPSDTRDSINLDQLTQEVRFASNNDGAIDWQFGGFFFDSDFTVLTQGFTFPPPVTVRHQNESWAVFGQVTAQLNEMFEVTGGLRFTDDEKNFGVLSGGPFNFREVLDERLSWNLSAIAHVTDDVSFYARVASGFRAPTIQGRDVAFFAPPSVATSEKIMSYEAGFKSELADRRIRLNGALYTYTVTDLQFSAVGGAGNLVQLVNADKGKAWGFELDSAFQITENFLVTAGLSYNDTQIMDDTLAVGICAQCTVTDPTVILSGTTRALVDGNPFPNAPDWIGDITARYSVPLGNGGELFAYTDWSYQGATNFFLYESLEFNSDNQIEGGLRVGYSGPDDKYELAAFARNITNADNVKGGIDFNNNTAFVNEPRIIGISGRMRY